MILPFPSITLKISKMYFKRHNLLKTGRKQIILPDPEPLPDPDALEIARARIFSAITESSSVRTPEINAGGLRG